MLVVDELLVLRVLFDEVRNERAKGNDLQTVRTRIVKGARDQPAAEAAPFAGLVDLGVRERDAFALSAVRKQADSAAVEHELVAVSLQNGRDDELVRRFRLVERFDLAAAVEVLDELPRHIRFAGVAVMREAAVMSRREAPRLPPAQMREDLARPAVEPTVLGLEHRDCVGAGKRSEPFALLREGLDLTKDDVDPQLCQHFANRG